MQINQKEYAKYDVQDHLSKQRGKFGIDRQLIQMKVEQVLVLCGLLKFEYLEVLDTLIHLMFLPFNHDYTVEHVELLEEQK